jgi:hypothetical protein
VAEQQRTDPGDERDEGEQPIRQRSPRDAEREAAVNRRDESRQDEPGGAEGGDESPSADLPMGLPADDQAPLGSTDQHSDPHRLPPHREQANRKRLD